MSETNSFSRGNFLRPMPTRAAVILLYVSMPSTAWAIPSPELIIGSASSISQIFAVGIATAGGFMAFLARRLGFTPANSESRRYPVRLIVALFGMILCLGLLNYWQYRSQQNAEVAHLQATLTRPAQFDGTQIQDANLKETDFRSQVTSVQSVTTAEAERLLQGAKEEGSAVFFDIRETGEHKMGTLPGATHVRFPDFSQSLIPEGKKVVLFCHNGNRSSETCEALAAQGIDCSFIAGGIEKWIVEGRPFSDPNVRTLSDLRAIPEYPNRDTLIGTAAFKEHLANRDLQIIDARYPGDFATGHLPGAINIPVRALPTSELDRLIARLEPKPTIAACYDRRSCFMSQVLGLELQQRGIEFLGRYTTPWEYFVAPEPKPHVQEWLAAQNRSYWQQATDLLAAGLIWSHGTAHLIFGLLALSLISRIMILPVALKSERDQMVSTRHAAELKAIKTDLRHDPVRKARALQGFYAEKGMTPMRNLLGLLFLPLMMIGIGAAEIAGRETAASFLWYENLGTPDASYLLPVLLASLGTTYLVWIVGKTPRQKLLWAAGGFVSILVLVAQFSAAGLIYLCISLALLLFQRSYVTGLWARGISCVNRAFGVLHFRRNRVGVSPLSATKELGHSGNKALRLSKLLNAGFPVPNGVVIRSEAINSFVEMNSEQRREFAGEIWQMIGRKHCAVRSSASDEDGADHSFAGVFESVLDVDGQNMEAAISEVISSFSSERAGSYRAGTAPANAGNILVQEMVVSEYAGVLFTQDPSAPGQMIVELVEGCGDDLVSGRKTPQSLRFGRFTLTSIDDQDAPIELAELLEMCKRIEVLFGRPQDIEWAYANGVFQIVQSRDVTAAASSHARENARQREWQTFFDQDFDTCPGAVVIEQDEMSELLPFATPLSFSFMGKLWAPGGSVDLAFRQLGLSYSLPEGRPGHLVSLFGQTYVDARLKSLMAARLSKSKARQLRKLSERTVQEFPGPEFQDLEHKMAFWDAVDFNALPVGQLLSSLKALDDKFVHQIYVEAEKINILAGLSMAEALSATESDDAARKRLMNPVLPHSPASMIAASLAVPTDQRESHLQKTMGHRAHFDYEFSEARYSEAPESLQALLATTAGLFTEVNPKPGNSLDDCVGLAIKMQDLKEQAKHEALRVFAQLRRAVLALGKKTGLGELVFYLEWDELLGLDDADLADVLVRATARKNHVDLVRDQAPNRVSLTLAECERLSGPLTAPSAAGSDQLAGTCVAGSEDASARVFTVAKSVASDDEAFAGFRDGDIIVCSRISPSWLPFLQRSGGVLSEIGGWLSHMAIVAREKDILMLVKCQGLSQLETGMIIDVGTDGSIVIPELEAV